jgi:ribonucleoside-diphosphate reductase alpha chain
MLPNTPTLVNSGREKAGLSACYVLDIQDNIKDIFDTKFDVALIARAGGGVGISLSHLRPEGSHVKGSSHEVAAGPVAFANTISVDAQTLTQAGSLRPMALMFVMDISHPDIRKFVTAKSVDGDISNANISVMVDDEFMLAVVEDTEYELHFQGKVYETVQAKELFNLIVEHTHKNGEPGFLFKTKTNRDTPYQFDGKEIYGTNPCGEIPAPDNAVCNLASLNLSHFVEGTGKDAYVNAQLLTDATVRSVHFLDKVITHNVYPTPDINDFVERYRPIGLGVMGVADLFLKMGIRYGSETSTNLLGELLELISTTAIQTSVALGLTLGVPEGCKSLPIPRRNMTIMSIAPTGSISIIAGCTSGIEPPFSPVIHRVNGTGSFTVPHPMADESFFMSALNDDPGKEVSGNEHLYMLSTAQRYVDSGVSKTINLPHDSTVQNVAEYVLSAWRDAYIKGLAIYRDGSRDGQVLSAVAEVDLCPNCKAMLASDGGCETCPACGYSLCAIA